MSSSEVWQLWGTCYSCALWDAHFSCVRVLLLHGCSAAVEGLAEELVSGLGQHAAVVEAVLQSWLVVCLRWEAAVARLAACMPVSYALSAERRLSESYSCGLVMFGATRHLSNWFL